MNTGVVIKKDKEDEKPWLETFAERVKLRQEAKIPIKIPNQRKGIKILTPAQMFQISSIVLAQVKARNASENLLNEIGKLVYSFHQVKEITRQVYKYIIDLL